MSDELGFEALKGQDVASSVLRRAIENDRVAIQPTDTYVLDASTGFELESFRKISSRLLLPL